MGDLLSLYRFYFTLNFLLNKWIFSPITIKNSSEKIGPREIPQKMNLITFNPELLLFDHGKYFVCVFCSSLGNTVLINTHVQWVSINLSEREGQRVPQTFTRKVPAIIHGNTVIPYFLKTDTK